jgi:hypothetical protein
MKKPITVDLKPYGAVFDDQTGRVLISAENNSQMKLLFQKGRIKSLVSPVEIIADCTPWDPKDKTLTADNLAYTFANEYQDEDLTLESIVGRTVESVRVYYPNAGNSNLTVTLLMVVPPVKGEDGKVIKPKRNDSPITFIITASFNPSKYIFN